MDHVGHIRRLRASSLPFTWLKGTLPELAVQQIISCDKTFGECQGEDLPTVSDYVQNTSDGIDSDSDYPQTSNVKGRTGHCEWDGNQVASVTFSGCPKGT